MEEKYPEPDVLTAVRRSKNDNIEVKKNNNRQQRYERSLSQKINKSKKNRRTIRRPELKKANYKGKKGLKNKIISSILTATIAVGGIGTAVAAVENYEDKNAKTIVIVQDMENDKFENSAPAKVDWNQRKKLYHKN